MLKIRPALKAIFSTANLNGTAATLMSVDMGTAAATAMYVTAVAAGTYNKYQSLVRGEDDKNRNVLLRALTPHELQREYVHPETKKNIRLDRMMALYAWHSGHHIGHLKIVAGGQS